MTRAEPSLLVTGGSGFVGRAFLDRLAEEAVRDVAYLVRSSTPLAHEASWPKGWTRIVGDLEEVDPWADLLPAGGTVVHLAAQTGKARKARHFAVNTEATRGLVTHARARGVGRFVFVSSVAAGFADQRAYPYARSKAAAEAAVREGGVPWTILRPTQVFGPGSAVLAGLRTLACAPIGVRFGSGTVRFQPVHRRDLADHLRAIVAEEAFAGRVVDVGGPDSVSVFDLLRRIRQRVRGRSGPWVTLPTGPLRAVLAALEPLLLPVMPLTAGQLCSFVAENDGTARPEFVAGGLIGRPLVSLDHMLAEVADA